MIKCNLFLEDDTLPNVEIEEVWEDDTVELFYTVRFNGITLFLSPTQLNHFTKDLNEKVESLNGKG